MSATRRPPARPVSREIDELTVVGEVYMRSLVRQQARHAAAVLIVVALGLGALPVTFALLPELTIVRLAGVPLPWLILGVAVYPLLLAAGWWGLRRAERVEAQFTQLARFTQLAQLPPTGRAADLTEG
jgi:hypothetical protein